MSLQKINTRTVVLITLMLIVSLGRLVSYYYPSLSNFTPLGAIALFGGVYFADKWKAYISVLVTLFLSDVLINYLYSSKLILWRDGAFWVYLPFLVIVLIGSFVKKVSIGSIALASLAGVVFHWLFTDLPFFYGTFYPHTLRGYGMSLTAAIPFERNMLLGDIAFGLILFGGFELAKSKFNILRSHKELAV
ncbi:DUF6580 family putative transport protein [Mucilaginibacter sp. L3T2-6]|uniref:DUF6580 family putative transport protein n=1 Tax=Mucilaginibacter sp. L3T2-6 TaxID=3062491 RepID=UPI0026765BB8|nr:DUF6580 family putative transport protein [Mucilaginibacter sp. L3T2-6]MDO3644085.1 hypothetical protein [Mucilaginibacter sp. L3T2-6]MDV6216536.1 DUF6580 family putative transport protein [Mucilaginibacter sp. L3T2-6]